MAKLKAGHLRYFGFPKGEAKRLVREHRRPASPPSPSHTPGNPTSSRPRRPADVDEAIRAMALDAGASPEEITIMMADNADPQMFALWAAGVGYYEQDSRAVTLSAIGEEARIMAQPGTDPQLRELWAAGLVASKRAEAAEQKQRQDDARQMKARPPAAPLGMDDDRFALHTQAKQLAAEKRRADPKLDEAEAYSLSVIEIEDAKFGGPI